MAKKYTPGNVDIERTSEKGPNWLFEMAVTLNLYADAGIRFRTMYCVSIVILLAEWNDSLSNAAHT